MCATWLLKRTYKCLTKNQFTFLNFLWQPNLLVQYWAPLCVLYYLSPLILPHLSMLKFLKSALFSMSSSSNHSSNGCLYFTFWWYLFYVHTYYIFIQMHLRFSARVHFCLTKTTILCYFCGNLMYSIHVSHYNKPHFSILILSKWYKLVWGANYHIVSNAFIFVLVCFPGKPLACKKKLWQPKLLVHR